MDGSHALAALGLDDHATPDDVDRAFRASARRAHPDHGGDAGAFRRVLAARDTLRAAPPHPFVTPVKQRPRTTRTCGETRTLRPRPTFADELRWASGRLH